jgi:hypothetical protein
MEARARQVGFMSTQKRESYWQRMSCSERAGAWKYSSPAHIARFVCAVATGQTAPLLSILWSAWAWFHRSDEILSPGTKRLATKFLQSDHLIRPLVRPVLKADRRGSPPLGAGRPEASPRSSLPHIPFPSGLARFQRTLPQGPIGPQAPAGYHRRAERYDGKRDMYFQHAA